MTQPLLSLAEAAVKRALRAGAEQAEAFVLRESGAEVALEKNQFASTEWGEEFGIGLRVVRDHRLGFSYVTRPQEVLEGVREALKHSRLGKPLKGFRFPAPAPAPTVRDCFDANVADAEAEAFVEAGSRLIRTVHSVRGDLNLAGGSVGAGRAEVAVANSEGLALQSRSTGIGVHAFVVQEKDGVSTGFSSAQSCRLDVDYEAVGREAAELALASRRPKKLSKGGRWDCLVRPEPASDLFGTITLAALSGRSAHRNESFYSGKVGRRVAHAKVSLVDDATTPGGLGSAPTDDEGVPSRALRPLQKGTLQTFLYDAATAHEHGGRLTGHGIRSHGLGGRSYKGFPTPAARQVRFEAPQRGTEKILSALDRGLVLHNLMGVHTANTVSGDFSVTSTVLFEVRKGAVVGPVAPVGVSGNLHAELRRGFTLGDDVKRMGGEGAMDLPSVLFSGFTVTP